jgi:methylenetetrahydrofolate--tRNA-(uracil-5-)-methyltransferase
MEISVIGGGLAGSEAAYQIALRGQKVVLYEMRPQTSSPAHRSEYLAELVCSNSFKSMELANAHGLLKEEMRILRSLIMDVAVQTAIPGGKALVVDRERFAQQVTDRLLSHPLISIIREEVHQIPEGTVIVATGPLTSEPLADSIASWTGEKHLHFYDAISPIVEGSSIDMSQAFFGSRYSDSGDDYLNCPLSEDEYRAFYEKLLAGERVGFHEFEKAPFFEGCLPVEVMAERGRETLLYGPMKPVGITDPRTGRRPFAVLQLRREDSEGTMFNLVGFQTKLTYPAQEQVFRLVPALRHVSFLRHGSIHRNTYINAPAVLNSRLQLREENRIFFAGQLTGVEGYIESAAMGLIAGISACCYGAGKAFSAPPEDTCIGSLIAYITTARDHFQPMNMNFGLLQNYRKKDKGKALERALASMAAWAKGTVTVMGEEPYGGLT